MILVGIGGFFGAICRYCLGLWISPRVKTYFPVATWMINGSGSFALGILFGLALPTSLWQLLATGFLGAYTTFSTFSFESIQLFQQKQYKLAVWYIISSVLLGIILTECGILLTK